MIKQYLAAALLFSAAAASLAAEATPFFVGIDVGSTKFDGLSDRQTSYGAFAGYQFTPYVGAELSYRRLGDVALYSPTRLSTGDVEQTALSVIGTLPLSSGFSLTGRYGRARLSQNGDNLYSERGTGALFGLGAQYRANDAITVRLETQKPADGVYNVSAGLFYSF